MDGKVLNPDLKPNGPAVAAAAEGLGSRRGNIAMCCHVGWQ